MEPIGLLENHGRAHASSLAIEKLVIQLESEIGHHLTKIIENITIELNER